uniref:Uncharacterized protein n=1 Tax=Salix viminalis TaxID=40686 RepID=A0A6N2LZE0_SALVM
MSRVEYYSLSRNLACIACIIKALVLTWKIRRGAWLIQEPGTGQFTDRSQYNLYGIDQIQVIGSL